MSSQGDLSAIIDEFNGLKVASYCSITVAIIVTYEYLITLDREVRLFWRGRLTGAAVLFFLNRYIVLALNVYDLPDSSITKSDASCARTVQANRALQIAQYIPWAAFAGLRAYALSRRWSLSLLAFGLSIVPVVINLVDYAYGVSGENLPLVGCVTTEGISLELARKFTILSRTCLISADVLLIYLTWSKLSRNGGFEHAERKNMFTEVLLRDGTIYFIALLIMNSLHLTFTLLAIAGVPLQAASLVPLYTEPLTASLISRFMLNLQAVNRAVTGQDESIGSGGDGENYTGTLVFNRVVGSIASSFVPGFEDDDDMDHLDRSGEQQEYELQSPVTGEEAKVTSAATLEEIGDIVEVSVMRLEHENFAEA